MAIVLDGTSGITNDSGYTGDGVSFADSTPANTLVTTSGGNVGIGTSSPDVFSRGYTRILGLSSAGSTAISVNGATGSNARVELGVNGVRASEFSSDGTSLFLSTVGSLPVVLGTNSLERARIDSSGNLLVGTNTATSGANTFLVNSAKHALVIANGATADSTVLLSCIKSGLTSSTSQRYIGFGYNGGANGNGAIAGNGDSQATFITLSDERLKENIENLPSQLANVMALRPVEFDYKATGGHQIGFIAQEVQAVYPDLVAEGDDGYLTLAGFDKNTARLIKAIQEQQAIITALTARVEALEGAQA
jgi:hypothetical protein